MMLFSLSDLRARSLILACAVLASAAIAHAHVRAVDQRVLKQPPFFHSFARTAVPVSGPIAVLPVRPYEGVASSPLFHGESSLATIAEAINARLATSPLVRRIDGPALSEAHWPATTLGDEELVTGEPRAAGNRRAALMVTRPSRDWNRAIQPMLDAAATGHYIVISVGVAELYLRQDWLGRKSLPIGTGHVVPVKWMNDLESTVGVLMLSGALYDRTGRLLRAGSEGVLAGRPTFWQGVLAKTITGGRGRITTIGDADDPHVVLETHRRTDLPDAPLAWEVALENLLLQLLQRDGVRIPAS
jgi:hypothetical protein